MTAALTIAGLWLGSATLVVWLTHRAETSRHLDIRRLTPDLVTCQSIWRATETQ